MIEAHNMNSQDRKYLEDVPIDIQDLIFEGRNQEALQLLMDRKGLGRMLAAMETADIIAKMREEFPEAVPDPPPKPKLTVKQDSIIAWSIVSFVLFVGTMFAGIGLHGLTVGFKSKSWPSTEGRIMESNVESRTSGSGRDSRTVYDAVVVYEFTVGGVMYKGDRVTSSDLGRDKSIHARRVVKRYPKNGKATVYYNPENPSKCLLEPGVQGKAFVMPSVGLFVLLIGIGLLYLQLSVMRDRRKEAEQSLAGGVPMTAPEE